MPKVLNVGQCVPDHMTISSYLRRNFNAEVVKVDSESEALDLVAAGGVDLVLVNRLYDADGSPGLETVRAITSGDGVPPVMLVSNYEDAQEAAVKAGAEPGFGKGDIGTPAAEEKLKAVLT